MEGLIATITPVLMGLVQAMKQVPFVQRRTWLLPFISVLFGVLLAYLYRGFPMTTELLWPGFVAGVAAGWAFDVTKGIKSAVVKSADSKRDALI